MINFLRILLILFLLTSISFAQGNIPSDGKKGLSVGKFLLGAGGDVSFPFGEEFKAYAGTGFSGHVIAGYSVLNNFLLTLKIGYIKFGEKDLDFNSLAKISQEEFSATQTNSQVPVLFGIFFTPILDPTCLAGSGNCFSGNLFNPYIGLQGGLFFKTYKYKSTYSYEGIGDSFQQVFSSDTTENSTIFGLVPTVGSFYSLSESVVLNAAVEYNYLFEEADVDAPNISFLSLNLGILYKFN